MSDTYIASTPANLTAFENVATDKPIQMLNFIRFRETAEYPDGHEHSEKQWSGQRAYQQYGAEIAGPFGRSGARIVWQNTARGTIIGPDGEAWDSIFVVEYPNPKAFQTMVSDPEYLAGAVNRTAAVADSRLYMTTPANPS